MSLPPEVRIIGVRGTTEPQTGSGLLKPIARTIARNVPNRCTYTELDYPASYVSIDIPRSYDLGRSPAIGVSNLVSLLNRMTQAEPEPEIVLLGYSQGAQVIGDALVPAGQRLAGNDAGEITASASDRILVIALFGDPRFVDGEPFNAGTFKPGKQGMYARELGSLDRYADRLRNYCSKDDLTCQSSGTTIDGHVSYFQNDMPDQAAAFIVEKIMAAHIEHATTPPGNHE
jgi:cutinase